MWPLPRSIAYMIFFILFLFLSVTYSSSLGKKKASEIEDTVAQQSSSNLAKRSRGSNDIILPEHIICYIGTYLENPFKTLKPLSVQFNEAMKKYSPQYILQLRSSPNFSNFNLIPNSRELNHLLALNPVFLNSRFEQIFALGSIFKPISPVMVEYAIKAIFENPSIAPNRLRYARLLVMNLSKHQKYKSILKVLELVPGFFLDYSIGPDLTNLVTEAYNQGPEKLQLLHMKTVHTNAFLGTVSIFPISLELFNEFFENVDDSKKLLEAFLWSFTFIPKINLSLDNLETIRQRNVHVITSLQQLEPQTLILSRFVQLCNDLRYSNCSISNNFNFKDLFDQLNLYLKHETSNIFNPKVFMLKKMKKFQSALLMATILGNRPELFSKIIKEIFKHLLVGSDELLNLLKNSPDFLNLIKPAAFKKLFGVSNQVLLLEHNMIEVENGNYAFKNVYEQVKVYAKLYDKVEFIDALLGLYEEKEFSVSILIEKVAEECENPSIIIQNILEAFSTSTFSAEDRRKIAISLSSKKYLKSLLSPENIDNDGNSLKLPSSEYYIVIDSSNFEVILSLASELKNDRASDLRDRFSVKWMNIFLNLHLFPYQIVDFFNIFGISIGNFDISACSVETLSEEVKMGIDLIFSGSMAIFKDNPSVMNSFVDPFLVSLCKKVYLNDLRRNNRFSNDRNNPLLMNSYGLFALWQDRNVISFIKFAPFDVVRILAPKIDSVLFQNVIFNHSTDSRLLSCVFNLVENETVFTILLDDPQKLKNYFFDAIFNINYYITVKIKCSLIIRWDLIILNSKNFIDYEILLSIISPSELEDVINQQSSNIDFLNFLNYFMYTNGYFRTFPQLNRQYLTTYHP